MVRIEKIIVIRYRMYLNIGECHECVVNQETEDRTQIKEHI